MQRKFLSLYTYTLERTRDGDAPYGTAPLQPTTALMLRPLAHHCAQCRAPVRQPITLLYGHYVGRRPTPDTLEL